MMHDRIDAAQLAKRRTLWDRLRTPLLMVALPLLLIAGGVALWLLGSNEVSTDNAYVQQDKVSVSSDVNGRVIAVGVTESQTVKAGDVLIRIDPEPFEIAVAQADAALASARLQVRQLRDTSGGKGADVRGKREAVSFAEIDLERQKGLLDTGFTTRARYQQAEHELAQARSELASAEAEAAKAQSALSGQGVSAAAIVRRNRCGPSARATSASGICHVASTTRSFPPQNAITGSPPHCAAKNSVCPGHV